MNYNHYNNTSTEAILDSRHILNNCPDMAQPIAAWETRSRDFLYALHIKRTQIVASLSKPITASAPNSSLSLSNCTVLLKTGGSQQGGGRLAPRKEGLRS